MFTSALTIAPGVIAKVTTLLAYESCMSPAGVALSYSPAVASYTIRSFVVLGPPVMPRNSSPNGVRAST